MLVLSFLANTVAALKEWNNNRIDREGGGANRGTIVIRGKDRKRGENEMIGRETHITKLQPNHIRVLKEREVFRKRVEGEGVNSIWKGWGTEKRD